MHFQSAYKQYQPLFSNKAILQRLSSIEKKPSVQSVQSVFEKELSVLFAYFVFFAYFRD